MLWSTFAFLSCVEQSSVEKSTSTQETKGMNLSSVVYRVNWNQEGVVQDKGGGWMVQSDLGYKVHLRRGFLVTYGASLKPCEPTNQTGSRWSPLFWGANAWAGHGQFQDASAVHSTIVEDLTTLNPRLLGQATFPLASYCEAELLIARSDHKTQNLPKEVDMLQHSLYLDLLWSKDDSKDVPLEVKVKLAHSGSAAFSSSTQSSSLTVTQTRLVSGLFDQIEFKTEHPARVARQVLSNLMSDVVWTFTAEEQEASPNPTP